MARGGAVGRPGFSGGAAGGVFGGRGEGGAIDGDAGAREFVADGREEARGEIFEAEGELGRVRVVAEVGDEVGEFDEVFVGEVFFNHGLVAVECGEFGPEAVGGGVGEAEHGFAAEVRAG